MTKTALWTNASPTSSFAEQNVTLSKDIDNFDYLEFEWNHASSTTVKGSLLVDVPTFKTYTTATSSVVYVAMCGQQGTGSRYVRNVRYVSDTSVQFSTTSLYNGTGAFNTMVIPTNIYGVKK